MTHGRVISRARARSKQAAVTAKAQQDIGSGSTGEIERLNAHIAELSAQVRRLELENDGLRRQLAKAAEGAVITDYYDCAAA